MGLALAFAAGLPAQNLPRMQAALAKQYCGRPLLMQNFRSGSTLHFSSNGGFIKGGRPGPWTLDAYFQVKKVKLKRKALRLIGRRVVYEYIKSAHRLRPFLADGLTVEIRTDPTSLSLTTLQQALGRIFAPPSEKLVDFAPSYWKYYLMHPKISRAPCADRSHCKPFEEVASLMSAYPLDYKHPNGVTLPKPLSVPNPPYTLEAREAWLQGTIVLGIVIGVNGRVENEMLIRPLGLGLDEQAAQTLRTWTFTPATRAGKPIRVAVWVEVRFRVFRSQ